MGANEDHRARIERLRRWEGEQRRGRETQEQQAAAAARRVKSRRRDVLVRVGVAVMVLGVLVAVTHMVRHLGSATGDPGAAEDLVAGYPTAAVLFVAGLILAGRCRV